MRATTFRLNQVAGPVTAPFIASLLAGRVTESRLDAWFYTPKAVDDASPLTAAFVNARNRTRAAHEQLKTTEAVAPTPFALTVAARPSSLPYHTFDDAKINAAVESKTGGLPNPGFLSPDALSAAGFTATATASKPGHYELTLTKSSAHSADHRGPLAAFRAPIASVTAAKPESTAAHRGSVVVAAPVVSESEPDTWGLFLIDVDLLASGGSAKQHPESLMPDLREVIATASPSVHHAKPIIIGRDVKEAVVRHMTKSRVTFAGETCAVLERLLADAAAIAKTTFEYGSVAANRQAVQRHISVLAATIFAVEAAGLVIAAVDANSKTSDNSAAQDAALLAAFCRRALIHRSADVVNVFSPTLMHLPDSAAKPLSHRLARAVYMSAPSAGTALGPTDSIVASVLRASIGANVAPASPNLISTAIKGKQAVAIERANGLFPVHSSLKTSTLRLAEDVDAIRTILAAGPATNTSLFECASPVMSELFASSCALFRASSLLDHDEAAAYGAGLRAQVFLDTSAQSRSELLAIAKHANSPSAKFLHQRVAKGGLHVTPPSELPNVSAKAPSKPQTK